MSYSNTDDREEEARDFGSGIALKTNDDEGYAWDFAADETGDLKATSGRRELQKDLAFFTARLFYGQLGQPQTQRAITGVESAVFEVASNDPRIIEVVTVEATPGDTRATHREKLVQQQHHFASDEIRVYCELLTAREGEQEFVFSLPSP